ncbi:MAG: DUF885 domain-containing protein [Steroidobacteraceae bacterium]
MTRIIPALLIALLAGVIAARARQQPPVSVSGQSAAPAAEAVFGKIEHEYVVYFMGRFPVVATYLGGSAFDPALADIDGKLRDYSAAALTAEDSRLAEFRRQFETLDPASLTARRRIDRSVVMAQIDFLLHQHQVLRHQLRSIDSYVDEPFRGIDWQIQGMSPVSGGKLGTPKEWREVIARTRAIPQYMAVAQQQIAAGVAAGNRPDWRVLREFGLKSTGADAEYFAKTLPELARADIDAPDRKQILEELDSACAAAALAYGGLHNLVARTFFEVPVGHAGESVKPAFLEDRFAAGEDAYDWALRNNLRLNTTAADLYDKSLPIVESTRLAMVELAQQIGASHHWQIPEGAGGVQAVLNKLSLDAPTSDAAMLEAYRATGVRLVDYARRTGLFEVPADYRLDVVFTPSPLRSAIDGAAYYPAPPFKHTGVGRFYVNPTGNNLAELRLEHNLAALPDLAAHEGFPGHDWHYKTMSQYRDTISPVRWLTPGAVEDSSSMWEDSLAAEGWALYAEGLLAEPQESAPQGLYTPEEHLYQLQGLLYRNLRVRIDTGLHTGRLSFEDAVTLFSEMVDFQPGSCLHPDAIRAPAKRASCDQARSAIERYARWPTQAITYRVGKDQILDLRAKARSLLGPRFSLQRFHLEFMKQGTIPANYFAEELLRTLDAESTAETAAPHR